MVELTTKELYGGAITIDIPTNMIDASTFRQIPDTQEVFVGKENPDYSIIVDLLECVPATTLDNALDEHMQEITRLNGAQLSNTKVLVQRDTAPPPSSSTLIKPTFSGIRLFEQIVPKFGKSEDMESVIIAIALLRLPAPANTDILITVNSHVCGGDNNKKDTATSAAVLNSPLKKTKENLEELAAKIVQSIKVCNLSLFVS